MYSTEDRSEVTSMYCIKGSGGSTEICKRSKNLFKFEESHWDGTA